MDESTPIEATPFSYLIPSFADDDNHHMENIPSPTSQVVTPLQTVDDETSYTTPPPILQASPLQPANEENYNTPTPYQPLLLATPLSFISPSDESNTAAVDPNMGPIKRGRGRPKGSKNSKPSKKKMETSHPNNEVVVSGHNDETHNTSFSPHPPLMATDLQAIVPYDDSNHDSLADDDAAPSSDPLKRGRGRPKGSKSAKTPVKKLKPHNPDDKIFCPSFDSMITEEEKENGNEDLVDSVRMRFNAVCRRLGHISCEKAVVTTAFSRFTNLGVRTNKKKRIGPVPGVQPGDIFYFWGEMCLVGLHTQMPAGIDYLLAKDGEAEGLTTSVVTSVGHYNDKTDELHTLVYTGQGGTCKDGKPRNQDLARGNLALVTSQKRGNEVRVIRGVEDPGDKKGKVYIYDGLYVVTHYWIEKGTTGFDEFKFNLVRKQDQPSGFATWKLAEELMKCGSSNRSRKGFVFEDISLGLEALPVPIVNEIDENDKEWPLDFDYRASPESLSMMIVLNHQSTGCNNTCQGGQSCGDPTCLCIQRNGGELPYDNRILLYRKPMIYECGESCSCPADCKNRLSQSGLKLRLEVFKTESCGWGLRSWEPIRAGTFICELVGTAKRRDEIEEDDEYVFDTSRVYKRFRWNYEPELVGEDCWDEVSEVYKLRSEILVSARAFGNVSRFMNHSCLANVMWQPVEFEKDGQPLVRIAFFAKRHIPPLTELRYDYGMSYDTGEVDEGGSRVFTGKRACLCGSENCRGSFE
ncbi:histone-lysine N-methyltransferase, H3 lysine-9 specific SUVH7-like [Brassica rapa]|uniref:histone-lysine N-methyltransferase, H3 lysine-9 specific SUVH7-like n=1 Tax=Brassica campestris TaxID=3711 RepID=UPI00142DD858|nr:histone-lysine N-methyltransferase, H3 lysine-9 specific SUVH7-like [Brassica rapa]